MLGRIGAEHLYGVCALCRRRVTEGWKRHRHRGLADGACAQPGERRAPTFDRQRIVPSFPERCREVAHGRASDLRLHVVPRRAFPVALIDVLGLRVAAMVDVVAAAVTQIDAADERDVAVGVGRSMQDDQLLVMRPRAAHPLVKQDLAAGLVHGLGELRLLLLVEPECLRMGAPQQAAQVDPPFGEPAEQLDERWTVVAEPLVIVAAPIGEEHVVARTRGAEHVREPIEVHGPVDQRGHGVALGPGLVTRERRRRVPELRPAEEPRVLLVHVGAHPRRRVSSNVRSQLSHRHPEGSAGRIDCSPQNGQ